MKYLTPLLLLLLVGCAMHRPTPTLSVERYTPPSPFSRTGFASLPDNCDRICLYEIETLDTLSFLYHYLNMEFGGERVVGVWRGYSPFFDSTVCHWFIMAVPAPPQVNPNLNQPARARGIFARGS